MGGIAMNKYDDNNVEHVRNHLTAEVNELVAQQQELTADLRLARAKIAHLENERDLASSIFSKLQHDIYTLWMKGD
jgi:peptidoglycan hydrolase CwlO-like protein